MEAARHINNKKFGAVIFRKNANQITAEGGLWDTASEIYPYLGGKPSQNPRPTYKFPSGAKITFAHLEYEKDKHSWQGSQIAFIGFDELTHFTESQFFYMLSRNRSLCGVSPYIRGTTNPDVDSWVAKFIEWWIDQDTGYPIPERSGVIRWMGRHKNIIYWGDTPEEVVAKIDSPKFRLEHCKSVTFIASKLSDNKILMEKNPDYEASLMALSEVEMERLLNGNWKIKPAAGLFFKRAQVTMISEIPKDIVRWVRGWDLAATSEAESGEAAYTAGVLMGKTKSGRYVVANVYNSRDSADEARQAIKNTAISDKAKYKRVKIKLPQDPGQAGKAQAESFIKFLAGFNVMTERESGSKETRAEPFAAQWQHGNVDVLIAPWNEEYFSQLESFPESQFKDMVDASSAAFSELEKHNVSSMPFNSEALKKQSQWRSE